ncbi:MAG: hypothetical protein FWF45_00010 [Coriobacteriia bacterium]|nr:hypothetical protein [Coriobacteriia bacterium]
MPKDQPSFWRGQSPRLTSAEQGSEIHARFPQFIKIGYGDGSQWIGVLTTVVGNKYKIRIEYGHNGTPKVFMVDPQIDPGCLHKYDDGSMCLYWPSDPDNEPWKETSSLARVIIPWCAVWLHFYDRWLATGVWEGPEKQHGKIVEGL